jgi:hypothetical protein
VVARETCNDKSNKHAAQHTRQHTTRHAAPNAKHTTHSTQHTAHSTRHTARSTQHTAHSTQRTTHSAQPPAQSHTQHTTHTERTHTVMQKEDATSLVRPRPDGALTRRIHQPMHNSARPCTTPSAENASHHHAKYLQPPRGPDTVPSCRGSDQAPNHLLRNPKKNKRTKP